MGNSNCTFCQIVPSEPPGFGGVERIAHEIANEYHTDIYTFSQTKNKNFSSSRDYSLIKLKSFNIGKIVIPLPTPNILKLILNTPKTCIFHIPCTGSLLLAFVFLLLRKNSHVIFFLHAFLDSKNSFRNLFLRIANYLFMFCMRSARAVIVTSPELKQQLIIKNINPQKIQILFCCISKDSESAGFKHSTNIFENNDYSKSLNLLFIGRLGTYKRPEWIIQSLKEVDNPCNLTIIGEGPNQGELIQFAKNISFKNHRIVFSGQVSEDEKHMELEKTDLLILPSETCNEAFGIVQLEAMAFSVPSLALKVHKSWMHEVCNIPEIKWNHHKDELGLVINMLGKNKSLLGKAKRSAFSRYLNVFSRRVWALKLKIIFEELEVF